MSEASLSAVVYVWFYGFQCRMFGAGHDLVTVLAKAAFDQFVWTPFVMVPLSSAFFLWLGSGFSFSATFAACRGRFVHRVVLPDLLSNWCVWIPVMFAIYAFPRDLQVQVLGLVGSFWTLPTGARQRSIQEAEEPEGDFAAKSDFDVTLYDKTVR